MFKIRPAKVEDLPFVINSWLKRYRDAVHPRLVTDAVYFKSQHAVIAKILQAKNTRVLVACDPEDENQIFAYAVGEHLTDDWVMLHWCYVKGAFRKFGLSKALLTTLVGASTKIHYSHRTKLVDYLDKNNRATFCPQYVWAMADIP